jgi:hypothetical protein
MIDPEMIDQGNHPGNNHTLASDPEVDSVRQKAANRLPAAKSGRYFSFMAGVPTSRMPL